MSDDDLRELRTLVTRISSRNKDVRDFIIEKGLEERLGQDNIGPLTPPDNNGQLGTHQQRILRRIRELLPNDTGHPVSLSPANMENLMSDFMARFRRQ